MVHTADNLDWLPLVGHSSTPIYLQILEAIEAAVNAGILRPGERLPTQRATARHMGIDLTTVTRAYSAAQIRNLLVAVPGRGSFVAARDAGLTPALDLSMNIPPPPKGMRLGDLIDGGVREIIKRTSIDQLMSYHTGPGALADRSAGAAWLEPTLDRVDPDRVAITAGAQAALAAILMVEARSGDIILTDELTYPGMLRLAPSLGLRLMSVENDEQGMCPDALERECRRHGARLVYITPTMHNPTAGTIPMTRRRELAQVILRCGLTLIEDDPYAALTRSPLPALATLAPRASYHVATVSKCLTPGLRSAYVVPPTVQACIAMMEASRALIQMPAPMMSALLTLWIRNGTAHQLRDAVREEAAARQVLARELLPAGGRAHPDGLHVWQPLPAHWSATGLIEAASRQGLGISSAEAFHVGGPVPQAVRISLGAIGQRTRLETALKTLANVIEGVPAPSAMVT